MYAQQECLGQTLPDQQAQRVRDRWSNTAHADMRQLDEGRRLGLVLGGGGGRGGAHLGMLSVLAELQVPIDGSSIGGVIGVFYAAGFSSDQIEQIFPSTAIWRIATGDPTRTGLIGTRKIAALLQEFLGERTFDDLHIPCAVMATDLVKGCAVMLNQGPLVSALLATIALPGIFPPLPLDTQLLADGSILNNLPVDVARHMGAQRVIAVELTRTFQPFGLHSEVPDNLLARLSLRPRQLLIAHRALDLLLTHATALRLAQHPPDLYLQPDVRYIDLLDMARPVEGRRIGEATARAARSELLRLRAWRISSPGVRTSRRVYTGPPETP